MIQIHIKNTGDRFNCMGDVNVLRAMEGLGRKGIPVGCRGGGCGICKVKVLAGPYRTGRMSRTCVSPAEEQEGVVLACKLFPDGDLDIEAVGKMVRAITRNAPAFPWSGCTAARP